MRIQFPLFKLFVVAAVYAVAFGAFSHLGAVGFIIAGVVGTAASMLVLVIRDTKGVLSGVIVAVGSLTGAFFAAVVFMPPIINRYTVADCARDITIVSVGTLLGGLVFSWASKR